MTGPSDTVVSTSGPDQERSGLHAVLLVPAAAAVWWLVGFLPWLLHGRADVWPSGSQWLALPMRTSSLALLVVCTTVGAVLAGMSSRLARRPTTGVVATGGGVLVAAFVSIVATSSALGSGGSSFDADVGVLTGLAVGVLAITTIGWAIGACSVLGQPSLGVALAVLAGAGPVWLGLTLNVGSSTVLRWVGAALLVAALVVVGVRPVARLAWWPLVLVVAWFVGPMITAAGYLEQLLRDGVGLDAARVADALDAAMQVFRAASSPHSRGVAPMLAAIVVAVVVALLRTRRAGESADARESAGRPADWPS